VLDGAARLLIARTHVNRGELDDAFETLSGVEPSCEAYPGLWGAILLVRGVVHRARGQYALAQDTYRRCLSIYGDEPERLGSVRHNLAACLVADGAAGQAEMEARSAIEAFEQAGAELSRARALALLGHVLANLGRAEEARRCLDDAIAIAQPAGLDPFVVMAELERSKIELDAGDPAVAEAMMIEAYHLTGRLKGGAFHPGTPLGNLAICQALLGKEERSRSNMTRCQSFYLANPYIGDGDHYQPFAWVILDSVDSVEALTERYDRLRFRNQVVAGLVDAICAARGWPSPNLHPGCGPGESLWVRWMRRLLART